MVKKIGRYSLFFGMLAANYAVPAPASDAPKIFFDYLAKTKSKKAYELPLFNNEIFIESGNLGAAFKAKIVTQPWLDKRLHSFLHGNTTEFEEVYGVKGVANFSTAAEKVGQSGFKIRELKKDWYQIFYVYQSVEYTITFTVSKGKLLFSEIGLGSAK